MNKKVERIRKEMKSLDLLILNSEPNVRYLTNQYELGSLFLIPRNNDPFILSSPLEKSRAEESGFETFSFSQKIKADIKTKNWAKALRTICKQKKIKIKNIGYEKYSLNEEKLKKITKKIKDFSEKMLKIRSIKDEEEIRRIKTACKITDRGMKIARQIIKPNMTELDIARELEYAMRKDIDWYSFQTIVASGPNSALPHHMTSKRKIRNGEAIVVDMGVIYKGYCSDVTRSFLLGKNKEVENIYKTVINAQNLAFSKIRSNIPAITIDNAVRNFLKKQGYEFIHSIGHGIGIEVHESPSFSSNEKLKQNMVFTIEPGIYLNDRFGIRIEDMILLRKNRIEILTKSKKDL